MKEEVILKKLVDNMEKVIVGKREVLELLVAGFISNGHVLIEDVPGVGKTMMARSLAKSINAEFKRIQFTPDLLPSDITGSSVYIQKTQEFEFRKGPIFANIVLADEINRTTPRTQSSLLECMEECQVSADGKTYFLPKPFLVIATQNPIEYFGTYPLPEAQIDRFLMKLNVGYPTQSEESDILVWQKKEHPIESLSAVLELTDILNLQAKVKEVEITPEMIDYIIKLISFTREMEEIKLGGSPRASLGLMHASRALALLRGRDYVTPDDVARVAPYVLRHRLILSPKAKISGSTTDDIISKILNSVPIPT